MLTWTSEALTSRLSLAAHAAVLVFKVGVQISPENLRKLGEEEEEEEEIVDREGMLLVRL